MNLFPMDAPHSNGNEKLIIEERLTQVEKKVDNCLDIKQKIEKIILNQDKGVEPTKPLLLICLELHEQQNYMNSQFEAIFSEIDQLTETKLAEICAEMITLSKKQKKLSDQQKKLEKQQVEIQVGMIDLYRKINDSREKKGSSN